MKGERRRNERDIEKRDGYSVATYCDPRYKDVFFQRTDTKSHVESVLAEEILAKVQTSTNPPPPINRIPSTSSQSSLNDSSEEQI